MNPVSALGVVRVGVFAPYTPADPSVFFPAGFVVPPGALFLRDESNRDLSVALDWNASPGVPKPPTGQHFLALNADKVVRMSLLDNAADKFGNPDRTLLFPYLKGEELTVYRVGGLPKGAKHGAYDGWTWDGSSTFTPPPPPARVCSKFQGVRALKQAGLYAVVDAAIEASNDDLLKDAWKLAAEWRTDSPFIQAFADELNLGEAGLEALFDAAQLIVA